MSHEQANDGTATDEHSIAFSSDTDEKAAQRKVVLKSILLKQSS
jgi:hypothetical protein